nr:hypothetical protein [uncultured Niameybacter sp.]
MDVYTVGDLSKFKKEDLEGSFKLIQELQELAQMSQNYGILSLQEMAHTLSYTPFSLMKGLSLMLEGIGPNQIQEILENYAVINGYTMIELLESIIIINGLLCIQSGESQIYIQELLLSFIPLHLQQYASK